MREHKNNSLKVLPFCLIGLILCVVFSMISLASGRYSQISFLDSLKSLFDYVFCHDKINPYGRIYSVVLYIRLPRTLAALMIGAALACSGVSYQALFSNPIASQDTLGVTQGAAFGAVLGILLELPTVPMKLLSFGMGCIVVVGVFIIANVLSRGKNVTFYLLLIGMIATSFFQSLVSLVKYTADADQKLPQITYWLLGSLSKVMLSDLLPVFIFIMLGIIPLLCISWRMNLLILSTEEAESMGINLKRLRLVIIVCATLLTAVATSMAGCISWFGLLVPHVMRRLYGNDMKKLIPTSLVAGAFLLLVTDIIARCVGEQELPISILTSIVGAPLLIFILFRDWRKKYWN